SPSAAPSAPPPPPPPPPSGPGQAPRGSRLHRSTTNRMLGGVAGGIGDTYGIDPVIVRVAFVVLTWFGGLGVIVYLALWILLAPADDAHAAVVRRGAREPWFWVALVLLALGVAALGDRIVGVHGPFFWHAFW